MRVLVAGGTGMLGAPVVRALQERGIAVRVLTRRPERARELFGPKVEIATGDVTQPDTLAGAVTGCTAVHVSLRGDNDLASYAAVENRGLTHLLAAARDAGALHVTYLSGAGRTAGNEHLLPVRVKLDAEEVVRRCGLAWVIFRATHFMESLDLFMRDGDATILGRQPHRYHYLAAADFAAMVARAIVSPAAFERTLYAFGPQSWTMREALERFVARLHPGASVRALPLPMAKLIAAITANRDLAFATELFGGFAVIGEAGDPGEANTLLGAPTTTLDAWLDQRAAARRAK